MEKKRELEVPEAEIEANQGAQSPQAAPKLKRLRKGAAKKKTEVGRLCVNYGQSPVRMYVLAGTKENTQKEGIGAGPSSC